MERLTEWYDDGLRQGIVTTDGDGAKTLFTDRDDGYDAMLRCKEYEDTGLTPPEIMELRERDAAKTPVQTEDGMVCPTCGRKALPGGRVQIL